MKTTTVIIQTTPDGQEHRTDLTPVCDYMERLAGRMEANQYFTDGKHQHEVLRTLTETQLLHLASQLTHEVERYAKLWASSFTKEHIQLVEQMQSMREIASKAGMDLWPQLEGPNSTGKQKVC